MGSIHLALSPHCRCIGFFQLRQILWQLIFFVSTSIRADVAALKRPSESVGHALAAGFNSKEDFWNVKSSVFSLGFITTWRLVIHLFSHGSSTAALVNSRRSAFDFECLHSNSIYNFGRCLFVDCAVAPCCRSISSNQTPFIRLAAFPTNRFVR